MKAAASAARRRTAAGAPRVTAAEVPLRRVYQRAAGSASVPLSGTYTGAASAVQARVIDAATSAQVVGWTTVFTPGSQSSVKEFSNEFSTEFAPAAVSQVSDFSSDFSSDFGGGVAADSGTWTGSLAVPQGGWYKFQIRLFSEQAAVVTASNFFGVGDVWMFAGQSQQARMSTLVNAAAAPDSHTVYFIGGTTWNTPGVTAGTGGNGGITFLNLMREVTNVPQAICQVSVEGTAITDWESGDSPYNTAISRLGSLTAVAGILWHQGGTGIGTISRTDYKQRLATLRAGFQSAASVQRFAVFPLMHRTNAADTDLAVQETRRAHYEYISENPGTINLGWMPTVPMADDVHQTAAGSEVIARTYVHALLYAMGLESGKPLGPSLTAASRAGQIITLTVDHESGTSLKTNTGLDPTGFQVLPRNAAHADASALAISNITLSDSNIQIDLAADPGAGVDVYYQYGRFDPSSSVYDNTTFLGDTTGKAMQPLMAAIQTGVETGTFTNPALRFDNDTGHIRYPLSNTWYFPDADWTVGVWASINNPAGTTSQYMISTGSYGSAHTFNFFVYESGATGTVGPGMIECSVRGAGASVIQVIGAAVPEHLDTNWRLWIVERVKATETINIYRIPVNGTRTLYTSKSSSGLGAITPTVPTALATRAAPVAGSLRWLDGNLAEVFTLDGLLTAAEMNSLGGGADIVSGLGKSPKLRTRLNTLSSPIPNTGTGAAAATAAINGGVVLTEGPLFSVQTTAVQFNGTGMIYTMPDSPSFTLPAGDWTLGFMFSISENAGTNAQYLWSTGGYFAAYCINVLLWESASTNPDKFGVALDDGEASTDVEIISSSPITPMIGNGYYLWTVEKNTATGRINIYYTPVNGTRVLFHSHILASVLSDMIHPTAVMTIGGRNALATPANRYFGGRMYTAFQTDGMITQAQTQDIARGRDLITQVGLSPKWWHRFTSTAATLTDLSGNGNTATLSGGTATLATGPTFLPNA
jgi:hypothetical protein